MQPTQCFSPVFSMQDEPSAGERDRDWRISDSRTWSGTEGSMGLLWKLASHAVLPPSLGFSPSRQVSSTIPGSKPWALPRSPPYANEKYPSPLNDFCLGFHKLVTLPSNAAKLRLGKQSDLLNL